MKYSPEKIEAIAARWREGMEAALIAERFGLTPSQLSDLMRKNRDIFPKRRGNGKSAAQVRRAAKDAAINKVSGTPQPAPASIGVTAFEREEHQCAWPLWNHEDRFDIATSLYCGAPKAPGSSYCEHHHARSTANGTRAERRALKDAMKAAGAD